MKQSDIEKIKLFSTYLNNIAVAVFTLAGIGYVLQIKAGGGELETKHFATYAGSGIISFSMHLYARHVLSKIDKER
ncbi:MAG: hypothetical protein JSS08_07730 [Proteobacteria bacterium]|nr:hypothetical protein [Pseudomonadota bacterium]